MRRRQYAGHRRRAQSRGTPLCNARAAQPRGPCELQWRGTRGVPGRTGRRARTPGGAPVRRARDGKGRQRRGRQLLVSTSAKLAVWPRPTIWYNAEDESP
jgi:hypothetical protein